MNNILHHPGGAINHLLQTTGCVSLQAVISRQTSRIPAIVRRPIAMILPRACANRIRQMIAEFASVVAPVVRGEAVVAHGLDRSGGVLPFESGDPL